MKTQILTVFLLLIGMLQAPFVLANESAVKRAEADQYYLEEDFKKAYRVYFKLAKTGDHYSQDRIALMYSEGEGKSVDLPKAYAWAVLAEEGDVKPPTVNSDELLELTKDKNEAEKEARKLQEKYGRQALREKAIKQAERQATRQSGTSMGSNLSR